MGWRDRHYNRPPVEAGGFGARLPKASMVMWLLGINCVVFLLDGILGGSMRAAPLAPSEWGRFSIEKAAQQYQVWRWLTYQFLHDGILHLLVNMLVLYFFGRMMEAWWGSRRFLAFYLLCGASGAVLYSLLALVPGLLSAWPREVVLRQSMVGASGSIFGILVGCAVLYPHQRVMLLFPPIPMSMRTLALVFLGVASLSVIVGALNAGGEAAHLGGAALGWVLVRRPNWLNFADGLGGWRANAQLKKLQRSAQRTRHRVEDQQAQVNKVLDKVRDHGLHSLSAREKKILKNATDRQRSA